MSYQTGTTVRSIVQMEELIQPELDHWSLFQRFAVQHNRTIDPDDITPEMLTLVNPLQNRQQESAITYALIGTGTYIERVWGDLLPRIAAEFPDIGPLLHGMAQNNLPRVVIERSMEEILLYRDVDRDFLALALYRIRAAWRLRYEVVDKGRALSLWPPIFDDPDYELPPVTFTPILRCVKKRYWRLGCPRMLHPDSHQDFMGHNWDEVLPEVFHTYRIWYRLDQEYLFRQRFTIDPTRRHIFDPIWMQQLKTTGELAFGRVQMFCPHLATVVKIIVDDQVYKFNALSVFPPDIVRAVIEGMGEQPPIPVNPIDDYLEILGFRLNLCRLTQKGNVYRLTFSKKLPPGIELYAMESEARWLDSTHARVTGPQSPLQGDLLLTDSKIELNAPDLGPIGQLKWSELDLSASDTRLLISLWALWLWRLANAHAMESGWPPNKRLD